MFQRKKDALEQRELRVQKLQQESVHAVDVVESMFCSLQTVNDAIVQEQEEIDTYVGKLSSQREALGATYEKNKRIMGNIRRLLEADC